MRRSERTVLLVIIATGISSVAAQLYTIREFLAQFQGNEYVIAMTLFNWLVLGAFGTLAAHQVTPRFIQASRKNLAIISFTLVLLPVLQILAMRLGRDHFILPGSSVGFYQTLVYTLIFTAPYCLALGFVLPFSLFLLQEEKKGYPGAFVYIADNLGDVTGGALFSFVLIYFCTPMQAMLVVAIPLLVAVVFLFPGQRRHMLVSGLFAFLAISLLYGFTRIERETFGRSSGQLIFYQETKYGRIEVHKDQEQNTVFVDGVPTTSSEDLETSQEAVHFPLSQLRKYDNILLVSALGGMLAETEKYNPGNVDFVELDPDLTEVEFAFDILTKIPGLNVINMDGRKWLMESETIYDAVLVNVPEPETYSGNRFYTDSFFQMVKKRIASDGIFSFSVQGYDNYIDEPYRQKISSLFMTVSRHFKHVILMPGQNVFFLCSDAQIDRDIPFLLQKKQIQAPFVSHYFYGNVTSERISYLNAMVDRNAPINYDYNPKLMRIMFDQWFVKFDSSPLYFQLCVGLFLFFYLMTRTKPEFLLFSTGFSVMGSELLVIFVFQIFYGYIYTQLGVIVTIFLAGLMPGAILGHRLSRYGRKFLALIDGGFILLLGLFICALWWSDRSIDIWLLLLFSFFVSLLCGCQFPAAYTLCGNDRKGAANAFSADLMGAAFGTLVPTLLLLPYLGIIYTAFVLVGLKTVSLFLMVKGHERI